jgi:environmental stress-induced protein Ves
MTIFTEAVRLFFAMTALILVGLLSAPITGDFNLLSTPKATAIKVAKANSEKLTKKKLSAKKVVSFQEKKKLKLRKS